ncbi:SUMF1/EgtB/PvdO family nonheme iron enzyme [Acinetobacter sp. B51(2017)]|uniref:formylglycine-generating enzyme family protein n=1 Tax=Acinetobacter sp. B51(2017) TaxID=2060938 RepID=UPI001E2F0B13|nr:SUMF1/EgtB/PvdO family nonheme iron enzyme [Acinetobacter sp. B51(2017)]
MRNVMLNGSKIFLCSWIMFSILGCKPSQPASPTASLALGTLKQCQSYQGLPQDWGSLATSGMVWIPAGEIILGSQHGYPDEKPFSQQPQQVSGFWADQTEVTVAQFKSFVDATGYVTEAEKQKVAAVFIAPQQPQTDPMKWWQLQQNISWKHINGTIPPPHHPVRYITYNDALAYATWLGRDLPSELENEYMAKGFSQQQDIGPEHNGQLNANYWQGQFPHQNTQIDGFSDVAPVGCFQANPFGLHDIIGNLWEWTKSPYIGAHSDGHMGRPEATRAQRAAMIMVIKGGSFLCADNYCARYRAAARHPQEFDLATSHVGFRTIRRAP